MNDLHHFLRLGLQCSRSKGIDMAPGSKSAHALLQVLGRSPEVPQNCTLRSADFDHAKIFDDKISS